MPSENFLTNQFRRQGRRRHRRNRRTLRTMAIGLAKQVPKWWPSAAGRRPKTGSPRSRKRVAPPTSSVPATDRDSLNGLLDQVVEKSGKVDILVNGAGVNSPTPALEITDEEFHRILDVNLVGTLRACQVFANYFLSREIPGSIINLGSISGLNPFPACFPTAPARRVPI